MKLENAFLRRVVFYIKKNPWNLAFHLEKKIIIRNMEVYLNKQKKQNKTQYR